MRVAAIRITRYVRLPRLRGGGVRGKGASSQVLSAAQSLSRDSNGLKHEVGNFLNSVRAA